MNTRSIGIAIVVAAIAAGMGWYHWQRAPIAPIAPVTPVTPVTPVAPVAPVAPDVAAAAGNVPERPQPSALVKTEPLRRQALPLQLTAYGEVAPGQLEGVSFPRAGQVARLLVVQGQRVKRGAALATLASDPTARMSYAQATNARDFAQGELARVQELYALQLATESQVDGARRALRDAEANLAAQRGLGGDLGSATVLAPFDGVVVALTVAEGDRVPPGASLMQLGKLDVLRVQLGLEPDDSRLVKPGMPVTLAPVDEPGQTVQASIAQMQGLIDPKTRLVNALVTLPARAGNPLVPGMRVRASVQIGQREAWAMPRNAVLSDEQGDYVFQVADGRARRVPVKRELDGAALVGVSGALDPALPLVVLGNYELQDGMRVREGAQ